MAISKETERFQGLAIAIQKAKNLNEQVLFSHIKKLEFTNPLSFYQAGRERYKGERFFWQDPAKDLTITGLGNVKKIQAAPNADRYREVEMSWIKLQNTAVKTGVTDVDATGPLLFGGFSFDYETNSTFLWNQFGDNLFYIPTFMLSIVEGEAYLTTNLLCSPDDSEKLFIDMINEREAFLIEKMNDGDLHANAFVEQKEVEPEAWKQTVAQAVEEIKTTDLDKIVLARELRLVFERSIDSTRVLEQLIAEQPLSYIFSLEAGGDCFIGATPERLIKKQGNEIFSTCLAGSMGRGKSEEEDTLLGNELLSDQKNLQEHQYVVSMISNAFEVVCEKVMIPPGPELMKNRHIQHLFTPVKGICKEGTTIFECVENLHPTPAMGGLPKEKAVSRIREIEGLERGFYAGPLGWVDTYGNGEFAVGIRSALLQDNEASLFAGCGVVEDSTPESEFQETGIKFNPMLSALGGKMNE
ncbi:isochorismate synthase MenF [Peribacillus sp. NPDC097295]|uniref:isochorismate synthase n=1 Tax=Peribacillus sp. NPDC097295 TaxID=3364402 RepID=UPI00380C1947